jgi:hypothetical protein
MKKNDKQNDDRGGVQVQCVEAPDGVLTLFIGSVRVGSPLEVLGSLPRRGPKRVR